MAAAKIDEKGLDDFLGEDKVGGLMVEEWVGGFNGSEVVGVLIVGAVVVNSNGNAVGV